MSSRTLPFVYRTTHPGSEPPLCSTCIFWLIASEIHGKCRRYPPAATDTNVYTQANEACGEWQAKYNPRVR